MTELETHYLIIHTDKELNRKVSRDIQTARAYSVWASTPTGHAKLKRCYNDGKSIVWLFFVEYESGIFCALAKMASAPDIPIPEGFWAKDKYVRNFKLEWVKKEGEITISKHYKGIIFDTLSLTKETGKSIIEDFLDNHSNFALQPPSTTKKKKVFVRPKDQHDIRSFFPPVAN